MLKRVSNLKELVRVEFDAVLEPGDLGPGVALGHAEEGNLAAEHVLQLEVAGFDDLRTLEGGRWRVFERVTREIVQVVSVLERRGFKRNLFFLASTSTLFRICF